MRFHHAAATGACILLATGCADIPSTPTGSDPNDSRADAAIAIPALLEDLIGTEQFYAEIARNNPGFAGLYYNEDGALTVRLKGHEKAAGEALSAVASALRAQGRTITGINAQPAEFTFLELARWRHAIRDVLPPNVISVDVDERSNVLHLGIRAGSSVDVVQQVARSAGTPIEAITIDAAPEPELRQTLLDRARPIRGGVQFTWTDGSRCTATISGYWNTSDYAGFVTASHCSRYAYSSDRVYSRFATYYYQPATESDGNRVGYEYKDPPLFTGGSCAAGRSCRWSDALFVRYYSPSDKYGGNTIMRPSGTPAFGGPGPKTIAGAFTAFGSYGPLIGEEVQKVGAESGWTYGYMTASCVDKWTGTYDSSGKQVWILCSDITSIYSIPGDSGSPVFYWPWKDTNNIHLEGILWGGPAGNYDETWFSPCYNVRKELTSISFACT